MIKDRKLDGFFTFRMNESSVNFDKEDGFLTDQAEGSVHISADVSFFDAEMIMLTSFNCTGISQGSKDYDFIAIHAKSKYAPIVENAIRNLGDNIVQMIYGNYDIRKYVEKNHD